MKLGRLYSLVTKHWPRIAAGLVVVIGLVEFVVGGLTADSGLEFYLLAWAAATGGLWFLFEKAESSLSTEVREGVVEWLDSGRIGAAAWKIPEHFASLFDVVFTPRHWSKECFHRSCLASAAAVIIVFTLKFGLGGWSEDPASARIGAWLIAWAVLLWLILITEILVAQSAWWRFVLGVTFLGALLGPYAVGLAWGPPASPSLRSISLAGTVIGFAILLNFLPDYASLLETRWAIRWMGGIGKLRRLLVIDAVATALISFVFVGIFYAATVAPQLGRPFSPVDLVGFVLWPPTVPLSALPLESEIIGGLTTEVDAAVRLRAEFTLSLLSVSFYSAFFTSAWLWLYALGTVVARFLVRVKPGVGFLLRVTDVENQPFRSIGFVSVLIVSGLFLVGLPFVLL